MSNKALGLVLCGVLAAGFAAGCGEAEDVKTVFFVRILKGNAPDGVRRIDVEVKKDTTTFSVPIEQTGGGDIVFPVMKEIKLQSDQSGAVIVTAIARDAAGLEVGRARVPGTIVPGETITLELVFGVDATIPDGGMPDAGGPDGTVVAPAELIIAPGTHDYGTVTLGGAAVPFTYTVMNRGGMASGTLAATLSGAGASAFNISTASGGCVGMALAAGASCTLSVSFNPSSAGPFTSGLSVTGSPGGTALAVLAGTAVTPASGMALAPATHDFGPIVVGNMSATRDFTVTNSGGSASGAIAIGLSGSGASNFTITADTCNTRTLAPTQSCIVTVRFVPGSAGAKNVSLTMAASPGGSATSALSGTGIGTAALSIAPGTQDIGTLVLGNSANASYVVTNNGGVATGALNLSVGGASMTEVSASGCTAALAPGLSCTVTLTLTPTSMGAKSATVTVSSTPGGTTVATLTATVVLPGALTLSPGAQGFGSVLVGSDSGPQNFMVQNNGGATTGPLTVGVTGSAASDFRVSATTCGAPLPAAGTCNITVIMRPSASGGRGASLRVSATPGGLAASTLTGTGLALPLLVADASSTDLGTIDVGMQSGLFTWTLRNAGEAPTGLLSTALTGDVAPFTVVNGCNVVLPAGQSCTITVRFIPTEHGARTLAVTTQAAPGGIVQLIVNAAGRQPQLLNVTLMGNGAGTVTSTPAGIVCGQDCDELYLFGTDVTLSALPDTVTSVFSGWVGACSGTGACMVPMVGPRNVTATFSLRRHRLTVAQPTLGNISTVAPSTGINCDADCTEDYNHGTQVTLRALPALGYIFNGWTGDCAGLGDCVLSMTQPRVIGAVFAPSVHTVEVVINGGFPQVVSTPPGIDCNPKGGTCDSDFQTGTVVTLSPEELEGYRFVWTTGPCTNLTGDCTFTVTGPVTATVTYIRQVYIGFTSTSPVSVSFGGVPCSLPCEHFVDIGTPVSYQVTSAGPGTQLLSVTGTCTTNSPTDISCAQNLNGDLTVSILTEVLITVVANLPPAPSGSPSPSPSGSPGPSPSPESGLVGAGINCGATQTQCSAYVPAATSFSLTANSNNGQALSSWGDACAGTPITINPPTPCTVTPTGPMTLSATWVEGSIIYINLYGTGFATDQTLVPVAPAPPPPAPGEYIDTRINNFNFIYVPPVQRWVHVVATTPGQPISFFNGGCLSLIELTDESWCLLNVQPQGFINLGIDIGGT